MKQIILIIVLFAVAVHGTTRYSEGMPATGWNVILISQNLGSPDTVQGVYSDTLNAHYFDGDSSAIYKQWYDVTGGTTFVERTAWGERWIMFNGYTAFIFNDSWYLYVWRGGPENNEPAVSLKETMEDPPMSNREFRYKMRAKMAENRVLFNKINYF